MIINQSFYKKSTNGLTTRLYYVQVILIILLLNTFAQAQVCYTNGVTFSTQAEIDLFPSVNPGCTIIGENLILNGSNITNLDSLYSIEKIVGNFEIFSTSLTNFEGLNNLDTIGGILRIQGGQNLTNFEGLESLKKMGNQNAHHYIAQNSIIDFTGLDSIERIEGRLELSSCNNLTSLAGLENLTKLDELSVFDCFSITSLTGLDNVTFIDELSMFVLPNLQNLSGLESLDTCNKMDLTFCDALTSFSALSNFSTTNRLSISDCNILTSFNGLDNLNAVNTTLSIRYNDALNDISAIENTSLNISSLNIYQNPQLSICNLSNICQFLDSNGNASVFSNDVGCNGLLEISNACCMDDPMWCPENSENCYPEGITFSSQAEIDLFPSINPGCSIIGENLTINGIGITNLDSLISIEVIQGNLEVYSNSLTNFEGLNNLDTIGGILRVQGGQNLTNFEGLESLKKMGNQSAHHYIAQNSIINFTGLDSIECIEGKLELSSCNNLTSLAGLENLTKLDELSVFDCFSITSLSGLDNVTFIDELSLFVLPNLQNLSGLESLDTCNNMDLTFCDALTSISALSNFSTTNRLSISDCNILTSFNGLDNLNTVNTTLSIRYNDALNDISAIENTSLNISSLNIYQNPQLSICNLSNICQFLDSNGNASVFSNDVGCNGLLEISSACCMDDPMWCPENSENCYPEGITFSSQAEIDLFPSINPGCSIIGENLTINGIGITNLDSLISIEVIQGNLEVYSNSLTNFEGLNNLDTIGGILRIQGGQNLTNFEGLESLKKMGNQSAHHYIAQNSIINFTGLDSIECIEGKLELSSCNNLTSLAGLENLTKLDELSVFDCFSITSLSGLDNVTFIDELSLFVLPNLQNLSGLESLDTCNNMDLTFCDALTSISALSNFSTTNRLSISNCNILTSFSGLDNLNVINTTLSIRYNNALHDISAIENVLIKNILSLNIYQNPALSFCNQNNICEYIQSDGNSSIYSNDIGCNGIVEIEYDCLGLLSIFETSSSSSFAINSTDNFWHNPNNWRSNMVPTDSSYTIIPSFANTIIQQDSIANCKVLTVQPNATLTSEAGSQLNIWGKE